MIVVADAAPLISLAQIGHLSLLPVLYGVIYVPQAVYDEVVHAGLERPGAPEVRQADWIRMEVVQNVTAVQLLRDRLGAGESEAIVLALEKGADLLLINEAKGRRIAEAQGLSVTGTLGTLVAAKRRNHVDAIIPLLDALRASGFRMSLALYQAVVALANEE